jgi:hypothetical protein
MSSGFGSRFSSLSQIRKTGRHQFKPFRLAAVPEGFAPMKRDHRPLSAVREESPFATPPRVLVMADDAAAVEAVELAEALDALGADTEVRFGELRHDHSHPDAVIVAEPRGYRVTRHHPILESILRTGSWA